AIDNRALLVENTAKLVSHETSVRSNIPGVELDCIKWRYTDRPQRRIRTVMSGISPIPVLGTLTAPEIQVLARQGQPDESLHRLPQSCGVDSAGSGQFL